MGVGCFGSLRERLRLGGMDGSCGALVGSFGDSGCFDFDDFSASF